jgi:hypothetical protein
MNPEKEQALINWVNSQPLSCQITCIGDGHSGDLEYYQSNWGANIVTKSSNKKIGEGKIFSFTNLIDANL